MLRRGERLGIAKELYEEYNMEAEADVAAAIGRLLLDIQELKIPLSVFKIASQEDDGWFATKMPKVVTPLALRGSVMNAVCGWLDDEETEMVTNSIIKYLWDNGIFSYTKHEPNYPRNIVYVNARGGYKIAVVYLPPMEIRNTTPEIALQYDASGVPERSRQHRQSAPGGYIGKVDISDPDSYQKMLEMVKEAMDWPK